MKTTMAIHGVTLVAIGAALYMALGQLAPPAGAQGPTPPGDVVLQAAGAVGFAGSQTIRLTVWSYRKTPKHSSSCHTLSNSL